MQAGLNKLAISGRVLFANLFNRGAHVLTKVGCQGLNEILAKTVFLVNELRAPQERLMLTRKLADE